MIGPKWASVGVPISTKEDTRTNAWIVHNVDLLAIFFNFVFFEIYIDTENDLIINIGNKIFFIRVDKLIQFFPAKSQKLRQNYHLLGLGVNFLSSNPTDVSYQIWSRLAQ